jgi:predicted PurR-regulated permease PerM
LNDYVPKLSAPARQWVRFGALVAALVVVCWVLYWLRGVFTPVIAGLAIAYVLNPVVTWLERKRQVDRLMTVSIVFALLAVVTVSGGLYLAAGTVAQVQRLSDELPGYRTRLETWLNERSLAAMQPAENGADTPEGVAVAAVPATQPWWKKLTPLVEQHGVAVARSTVSYAMGAVSGVFNLLSLLVLTPLFTFYFLWKFNDMVAVARDHLPAEYREGIVHAVTTIDRAMADFFRGRVIVCLIVGVLTGLGWSLVPGQNYALPLGVLAGTLNLIPMMSMAALPLAMISVYLGTTQMEIAWAWPVLYTLAVYMIVQGLESFLLSPMIEGKASGLNPLVIVVALLIGAQMAGLLGMLLAIPVASTLRTFATQLVMPEVRRLAGQDEPEPPPDAAGSGAAPTPPGDANRSV